MERNNIILKHLEIKENTVIYHFTVSDKLKPFFTTDSMFLEYDIDVSDVPESILSIPFVSCFMAFAWITNSVVWVKELDRTFYEATSRIKQAYQDIYFYYPFMGRIVPSIIVDNTLPDNTQNTQAIMLFSGGADAHSSFIRNIHKHPLLCNIQGFYKSLDDEDSVADTDKKDISAFAQEYVLQTAFVKSNFAIVVNTNLFDKQYQKLLGDTWWHGFIHSIAFISIAIPVAYKKNLHEIIIASSLTTGLNHLCASNSTTDSEFRFASVGKTLHDGFELNRQDKIKVIVDHQRQTGRPYPIRVCSFNDHNCVECEKCMRTVLGIVAEAANPEDFDFHFEKSLKAHWEEVLYRRGGLMGFGSEKVIHWPHIKRRMQENYDMMTSEQKEFVDWFLSFDFDKAKKEGLRRYYRQNFFSILKRKLKL